MNDLAKNLLLWVIIAVVLMAVFQSFTPRTGGAQGLSYTEFLAQVRVVGLLDRLDDLSGLLDQVGDQRAVGLLGVPGTVTTQPRHHVEQPGDLRVLGHAQRASCSSSIEVDRLELTRPSELGFQLP